MSETALAHALTLLPYGPLCTLFHAFLIHRACIEKKLVKMNIQLQLVKKIQFFKSNREIECPPSDIYCNYKTIELGLSNESSIFFFSIQVPELAAALFFILYTPCDSPAKTTKVYSRSTSI